MLREYLNMSDMDPTVAARLAVSELKEERWEEEMERPRGIFTDLDRRFLWGVKSYDSRPSRSMRWKDIRSRVKNSILDLLYLGLIDEKNQTQVIEELQEEEEPGSIDDSVATFIEFLYVNLHSEPEWFEERVSQGITNAERVMQDEEDRYHASGSGSAPTVDVEIDVTRGYDVNELENRLRSKRSHTLTPTEIGVLVKEGVLDGEDIDSLQDNRFSENTDGSNDG